MNKLIYFLLLSLYSTTALTKQETFLNKKPHIERKVLTNGMSIFVVPRNNCGPVCAYLIYSVGSKHEQDGQKGIAHLIEHMIFKGTKSLSETDIKAIVSKLSGDCNAHTSFDYTGYYFNVPSAHLQNILPIMADCMQNASFKEEHLTSEMKVVIQELKMNRDNYQREAWEELCKLIFSDHPYHYPVVGYKHDLWNLHSDDLRCFYKKYYHPNNAALVIVGNVNSQEVFAQCEELFGKIPVGDLPKNDFYHTEDISAKTVTLYRNVKQPKIMLCYAVQHQKKTDEYIQEVIARLLTSGKNGLLTKTLVEEQKLVHSCWTLPLSLYEQTLFLIGYEPRSLDNVATINHIIHQTIESLKGAINDNHLKAVVNQIRVESLDALQNNKSLAMQIGLSFWAVHDPEYAFRIFDDMPRNQVKQAINGLLKNYFRTTVCHQAVILPLPVEEKEQWRALQEQSDVDDQRILAGRIREDSIEGAHYANKLAEPELPHFSFAKPMINKLPNGLKVFSHHTNDIPKIDLILELKANHYYDPDDKEGLCNFVYSMLLERTKNYTSSQLASELQSRAIQLSINDGFIRLSFLHSELPFVVAILRELMMNATFNEAAIEKKRAQLLAQVDNYWDSASSIAYQLKKEHLFAGQFLSKVGLGSHLSLVNITRNDLIDFYSHYFSPDGAKLSIVGDLRGYNLLQELAPLASWNGAKVSDLPALNDYIPQAQKELTYQLERDQVFLSFVGTSVKMTDEDYDALLIFDQIMCSGLLNSMSSRLFQLREQSGAFYSIGGSVINNITDYPLAPRIFDISCIVSLDRLTEAEEMIKETIKDTPDSITEQEIQTAKRAIAYSAAHAYTTNSAIAHTFLYLDRYHLPVDFFDNCIDRLQLITLEQIKKAAKKISAIDALSVIKVGRVG
jgi:zinc protease